ncbi:MAG TPA: sulfotransferase domain-containing protein [Patescibacteria group bacterium]|nr:sulfotransferase domain-containing protein [Patescibacteria group bacterium]
MTTASTQRIPSTSDNIKFKLHCLNRNLFAMSMLKYRDFQGYLVTGQHSGTHWVKWMLSHALAHRYDVPPPKFFNNASAASSDLIGHPKLPRKYPNLPRIASSHSIPPYALGLNILKTPPYALVVRDVRKVLVSHYEKWKHKYTMPFSEYVAGDPRGDRYYCDVYWYIRFMNRWGDVAQALPQKVMVQRYEDFQSDRVAGLRKISDHFGLALPEESLQAGAAAGAKEFMSAHHDPAVEPRALRPDGQGDTAFTAEDTALLLSILDKHLKHDFGYNFFAQPRGFQGR